MDTNVNYTLVGAFMIVLITAVVLGIIWLSSGFKVDQFKTYKIYMQESVAGLNVDSPVEFNGVNVGTIKSIAINQNNPRLVEVLLDIKDTTPITQGTVATLDSRGVTGLTYMQLKDKGTDLRPLVALPDQKYPVIRTAPSLFTRLDTTLSQLSVEFQQIAASIQSLLDPENRRLIKHSLHNIDNFTAVLSKNSDRMNQIFINTESVSRDLIPLVRSGSRTLNALDVQTLPATYQLVYNLQNMTRTLSALSVQLKQNPAILVRGAGAPELGPGERR